MCNCNFCCGNYAENGYWRDKQIKEYEDKIKELETKLSKCQANLVTWREKALYQAPAYSPYKPAEPIKGETTFIDILFILLAFIFPWVMIVGSFLFGWNGILR